MDAKAKKRCVLVIPDSGPLISLQKAGALHLLLELNMPIVVVDAINYELVIEPDKYDSDREIRNFLRENATIYPTNFGYLLLEERLAGKKTKHFGEAALIEFMKSDLDKLAKKNPVLLLFEDFRMVVSPKNVFPPNVHFLSTVAFLRGLEKQKIITSANEFLERMEADPKKRVFPDLPDGTDIEASVGSTWLPASPAHGNKYDPDDPNALVQRVIKEGLDPRELGNHARRRRRQSARGTAQGR